MKTEKPRAMVREVAGKLILDDPDALAMIRAVHKSNCINVTLELNKESVIHFKHRAAELNKTSSEVVIVIINVDDPIGGLIVEKIMPEQNWQQFRDKGQVPFVKGLVSRRFIQKSLSFFDGEAAKKLRFATELSVVIIDNTVAEMIPA